MRRLGMFVVVLAGGSAHAGGIGRPNPISARSIGMGGAFTAVADDPSALHFNPAGLALQPRDGFLFGGELIFAPRTYTPITDANGRGEDQSPHNTPNFVPTVGYMTRFKRDGVPSRLAFGVGLWNTFGGALTYDKMANRSTP